jgi:hypothetical protein
VAARLLHAPPPLAARWFTRRRKKFRAAEGSGAVSSPLAFLTGGDLQNTNKSPQTVDFIFFLFSFSDLFFFVCFQLWFVVLPFFGG